MKAEYGDRGNEQFITPIIREIQRTRQYSTGNNVRNGEKEEPKQIQHYHSKI